MIINTAANGSTPNVNIPPMPQLMHGVNILRAAGITETNIIRAIPANVNLNIMLPTGSCGGCIYIHPVKYTIDIINVNREATKHPASNAPACL